MNMNTKVISFLNKEIKYKKEIVNFLVGYIKTALDLFNNLTKAYIDLNYVSGYIYCIHNEMYGDNIYKIGCSKNVNKRLLS